MKKLFLIVFISLNFALYAQSQAELEKLLNQIESHELAPDQVLEKNRDLLLEAGKQGNSKFKAIAYKNFALIYSSLEYHDNAMDNINKSISEAETTGNKELVADFLDYKGDILFKMGEFKKAISEYTKSIQLYKELNLEIKLPPVYVNLGDSYLFLKDDIDNSRTKALEMFDLALELNEKIGDKSSIARANLEKGEYYIHIGNNDQAIKFYEEALRNYLEIKEYKGLARTYNKIAEVYSNKGAYSQAIAYLNKNIEISRKHRISDELLIAYKLKSDIFHQIGYYEFNDLNKLEESRNNLLEAYKSLSEYSKIQDSLNNQKDIKRFLDARLVSEEQRVDMLRMEKSETEEKLNLTEAEKEIAQKQQKAFQQYLIYTVLGLAILLLLVLFLYSRYSLKKKSNITLELKNKEISEINEKLKEQNRIIEESNTKILDSIRYAQRIQEAFIPSQAKVNKLLGENFVLFYPKDIVSGDFYYVEQNKDSIFAAVVDCTGHGVPGALMSTIGFTGLDRIINQREISDPATILSDLNNYVMEALNQFDPNSESDDSMDIALLVINKTSKKLFYAGAKRPLYQIKNNELIEHNNSKHSVGGKRRNSEKTYETIEIEDFQGSTFYLTSDGYADQNNKAREKYSTKRLKNKLIEINKQPMKAQKDILAQELMDYKGEEENRDDITILAIKF